ncbi:hypothetical protein V2J09_009200 [Rumex salicifolius]
MLARRTTAAITASSAVGRYFSVERLASEKSLALLPNGDAAGEATSSTSKGRGRDTLGRRLFSLVYPKRSAVVTIRKWKEEGHTIRKYELNRIVRELRKLRRYKHALEISEWMKTQKDIKLLPGDYAVELDLIAKLRGLNSAEKFFEDLPENIRGSETCTALLHAYVRKNAYVEAEALMEKMSECGLIISPLPYNHLLQLYISNGQLENVPGMIEELKQNTSPDVVTYNLWLTVCSLQDDIETAEKVFLELRKSKIQPDWMTFSILTSLYTKKAMKEKAITALKEMEKRISRKTRPAYSSLISLSTNLGLKDGVGRIWKKLKSLFPKLNDAEYNCMISSHIKLEQLEEAEKLYSEWESVSPTGDTRIPNLLLAAYINNNNIELARSFLDRVVRKGIKPSYTSWELLTWGYLKQKQMDEAFDCFEKAIVNVKKWQPDEKLIKEMYGMLGEQGDVEGGEKLLVMLRKVGCLTTEIYNMLLQTYAKAGLMPLVIAERMNKDKIQLDEETNELIRVTSKMRVVLGDKLG